MDFKTIDWKELIVAIIFGILITIFLKWAQIIP
jgi:hypothetical protein